MCACVLGGTSCSRHHYANLFESSFRDPPRPSARGGTLQSCDHYAGRNISHNSSLISLSTPLFVEQNISRESLQQRINMSRIHIPCTAEDAKAAPREYALLKQLETGSDGTVDAQVCAASSKLGRALRLQWVGSCGMSRTSI